jgi:hypothetical protein
MRTRTLPNLCISCESAIKTSSIRKIIFDEIPFMRQKKVAYFIEIMVFACLARQANVGQGLPFSGFRPLKFTDILQGSLGAGPVNYLNRSIQILDQGPRVLEL